jgi:hypothetical protein
MSHHSTAWAPLSTALPRGVGKRVQHAVLFLQSTPIPMLPRLLLTTIGTTVIAGQPMTPGQDRLAEMFGRRRETICKALAFLRREGLIRVKRRGRKLTNVYLLSRRLWHALTGAQDRLGFSPQQPLPLPGEMLHTVAGRIYSVTGRWKTWAQEKTGLGGAVHGAAPACGSS